MYQPDHLLVDRKRQRKHSLSAAPAQGWVQRAFDSIRPNPHPFYSLASLFRCAVRTFSDVTQHHVRIDLIQTWAVMIVNEVCSSRYIQCHFE